MSPEFERCKQTSFVLRFLETGKVQIYMINVLESRGEEETQLRETTKYIGFHTSVVPNP